jgi:hypothetical protein
MTTRTSIGGPLDWATLYGRDQYRPTDPAVIAAAILSMHHQGLKPRDIAVALKIGVPAVLQVLEGELA